jgi:hypothetical protein
MSTKSASGRLCTKVAKAKLISRLMLAFRTWISSPIVRAADCTSLNVVSELGPFGLTSTATRLQVVAQIKINEQHIEVTVGVQ